MGVIEDVAFNTNSKDPMEILEWMMSYPVFQWSVANMPIVTGTLLAALKNEGSRKITDENIKEAFKNPTQAYC